MPNQGSFGLIDNKYSIFVSKRSQSGFISTNMHCACALARDFTLIVSSSENHLDLQHYGDVTIRLSHCTLNNDRIKVVFERHYSGRVLHHATRCQ